MIDKYGSPTGNGIDTLNRSDKRLSVLACERTSYCKPNDSPVRNYIILVDLEA